MFVRSLKPVGRNPERDDWIVAQADAGKSLKEICNGINSKNKNWEPLDSPQSVFQVLKRRGKR
jgi:hypothetical protein